MLSNICLVNYTIKYMHAVLFIDVIFLQNVAFSCFTINLCWKDELFQKQNIIALIFKDGF